MVRSPFALLALLSALFLSWESVAIGSQLKIGLLINLSKGSAEVQMDRKRGFELAVSHINKAGGVFNRPVAIAVGDTAADPATAVAEARRLVETERVHAIVGPSSSASALLVSAQITAPAGIPTVSNSATSPRLTEAEDNDFLFRTAHSDIWQGPILARVARERGHSSVGLLYRDDAWGEGLAIAFASAWKGKLVSVATRNGQIDFVPELRRSASQGAQALIVLAFETEAERIVRQALDGALYDKFFFGDAAKRRRLVGLIGGTRLGGMYGTGPAAPQDTISAAAWEAAYISTYGGLPNSTYVREAYDATVALALAAEAAASVKGSAIRDHLRKVCAKPGVKTGAGLKGIAEALRLLRQGNAIDYDGASSDMDWDENGDIRQARIGIWRFTRDERIEEVDSITAGR